jgi:hypothetical protein
MSTRLERLERLIRRTRNSDRMWDDNDIYYHRLGKLKAALIEERKRLPDAEPRGPHSGLTRAELAATGTCEPDWY